MLDNSWYRALYCFTEIINFIKNSTGGQNSTTTWSKKYFSDNNVKIKWSTTNMNSMWDDMCEVQIHLVKCFAFWFCSPFEDKLDICSKSEYLLKTYALYFLLPLNILIQYKFLNFYSFPSLLFGLLILLQQKTRMWKINCCHCVLRARVKTGPFW